jgi:predicted MFS family arabinose efflux permease
MQRTILSNFASEEMSIRPEQMGWLESVREIPGLLTFLMVGLTVFMARNLLVAISVGFVGVGLMMYAGAYDMGGLVVATIVYSIGFHLFFPLQSAQVLSQAGPGQKAKRLGQLNSVAALAYLMSMGFVYLAAGTLTYRQMWMVSGMVTLGGVATMLALPRRLQAERPRGFVIRRQYWLYYAITFLASSRRQIVTMFAIFALVRVYGTPVKTIAALLFVSNVVAVLTRSLCGSLVDRLGERYAMVLSYSAVIFIFLGYAFVRVPVVLYGLYILDNFLSGFDVSQSTYLDKIAAPGDVPPSLALGSTINHITGVGVPIVAGYLWAQFGHSATFTFGAVVAAVSLYFALKLPASLGQQKPLVAAAGGGT